MSDLDEKPKKKKISKKMELSEEKPKIEKLIKKTKVAPLNINEESNPKKKKKKKS